MSELPVLPDLNLLDTDPSQIISDAIYVYEKLVGRKLQKSSPEYLFCSTMAAWVVLQRQQINEAYKQNFLLYAKGVSLDHLGAMRNTERLQAEGSKVTLRYTLSSLQSQAIVIPQGTRATADNIVFFELTENLIIPPGQLSGSEVAESIQTGAQTNNIGIGTITQIVDPIPFVASVTNLDVSLGGRDTETDDSYRERLYNAPSTYSTGGPRDAYIYLAKQASSAIGEVTVNTDYAGRVDVYPLLTNGEIPNQAILDLVADALDENTVRPLADYVRVLAPTVVNYSIDLTYYIYTSDAGNVDQIQLNVNKAIDDWVLWQRQKIGRDINVSVLITRIVQAGAKRVDVRNPTTTFVGNSGLAVNVGRSVLFGGLEDE